MEKSKTLKRMENILIIIGAMAFVSWLYIVYAKEYNFSYVSGSIGEKCSQGVAKGVEIIYTVNGKSYVKCYSSKELKKFKFGENVQLRVLNGFPSFIWIDLEETKKRESGVPPQKPGNQ